MSAATIRIRVPKCSRALRHSPWAVPVPAAPTKRVCSAFRDDIDLRGNVGIALAELHEGFEHRRRPLRLKLAVRQWLDPVASEHLNLQSRGPEVVSERFRVVDTTMTVVPVGVVEGRLI